MKQDDLEKRMRYLESCNQTVTPKGMYLVARLDGRGFSKLTKEKCDLERPFDDRFRDCMITTSFHLMQCGFRFLYGYTQSDEMSFLFHPEDDTYSRKCRKVLSILAGEASAQFTHSFGQPAVFDCRLVPLPQEDDIADYFLWRQRDAARNALSAHAYWILREQGKSPQEVTALLSKKDHTYKNDLLFKHDKNFDKLPSWQKRGIGFSWETIEIPAHNPKTGETTTAIRTRLKQDMELPFGDDYRAYVRNRLV